MEAGDYLQPRELDEVAALMRTLNNEDGPLSLLTADITLLDNNGDAAGHVQRNSSDGYVFAPLGGVIDA